MLEEERNHHPVLKFLGIMTAAFLGAFLAFYFVADVTLNRMTSPEYQIRKMEKMLQKQERNFRKFENRITENPFLPQIIPNITELKKNPDAYEIIVDLKPLDGNEKNLNVKLDNNIVTISGEMDKKGHHGERMLNFSQAFYLDENLIPDNMTKVKKGNEYIITIPYED